MAFARLYTFQNFRGGECPPDSPYDTRLGHESGKLMSAPPKFRGPYAYDIRLQSLQILYTFVLRLPQNGRSTFGEFPPFCGKRNTKVYKICKLCKRIFSVFYNISPPNLAILLILTSSF